jgi:threonine/homoserine/homoserine lactone efflux protein
MIAVVGLGLDIVFESFPQILPVMRVAGSIYMLWLALKIALAKPIGEVEPGGRPIGFLAAAGFQWLNPKAWMIALSALATYGGVVDNYTSSVLFIAALSAFITVPCSGAWTLFGAPPIQLDDGGVAGRLDRANPVRIGRDCPALRRASFPHRP